MRDNSKGRRIVGTLRANIDGSWSLQQEDGTITLLGVGTEIIIGNVCGQELYATLSPPQEGERFPHWVMGQAFPWPFHGGYAAAWTGNIRQP